MGLGFYERMFALWHVLHVPLFILLVITAVMHPGSRTAPDTGIPLAEKGPQSANVRKI